MRALNLRQSSSVWSIWISAALALAPITGLAAPPSDEAPPASQEPDEDPLVEAKRLFDAGVARYTAADYTAAVDLWLDAYTMTPSTYENRLIKAELIYNVARAERKSFEIDQDVRHLRQSREILQGYLVEIEDLYPADQAGLERERIQEQIDELNELIAKHEAEQARREAELAERMRPTFDEAGDAREKKRNKVMIGTGAGFTAFGVAGVGFLVAGLVRANAAESTVGELPLQADITTRESAINRGQSANVMIIAGSATAGLLLAVGAPLLGIGLASEKRRKQRRTDAGLDQARLEQIGPLMLPGGAGLSLSGSF